jgi:hypothetical protein
MPSSRRSNQVERQLPAGLGKGQIAQLVENDEVHAGQIIRRAAPFTAAGFGLQPVHEIDDIEEAPAGAASAKGPGALRSARMSLRGSKPSPVVFTEECWAFV